MSDINYNKLMSKIMRDEVFPYIKEHGFRQKGAFFIREKEGRVDVIDMLIQPDNNVNFAGFSCAIAFISPSAFKAFTGRRQPFNFQKKLLFHVPMGVLLCANQNLVAGFDYWYEFYDDDYEPQKLTIDIYKEIRPNISKEEFQLIDDYHNKMNNRYRHENGMGAMNVFKDDFKEMVNFFDSLPCDKDMIDVFTSIPPKTKIQSLMYASFIDYAKYFDQHDIAIAIQMMLNAYNKQ